jgi:hypothetical protein
MTVTARAGTGSDGGPVANAIMRLPFSLFLTGMLLVGCWLTVAAQQQPVAVVIDGLRYNPTTNRYHLTLTITNPETVSLVIVKVEEDEGGIIVENAGAMIDPHGQPNLWADLDASGMKPERKYVLSVQAVDLSGNRIQKPTDGPGSEDPTEMITLAEQSFTYEPPQAKPVEARAESATADYAADKLIVDLRVTEPERLDEYEVVIVDQSNQRVAAYGPNVYTSPRLELPLPPAMKQPITGEPPKYKIMIYLTDKDELQTEIVLEDFGPTPLPEKKLTEKIIIALRGVPMIQAGVVMIVLLVVSWFIFAGRRPKQQDALARPPIDAYTREMRSSGGSGAARPSPGGGVRLRVRVLDSPGRARGTERILTRFPCTIGREKADFIIDDSQVSKRHLNVEYHSGAFYVTDLDSTNGTTVGEVRLRADQPMRVEGPTTIRLGGRTVIELDSRI